jgi:hypothetical protein
MGMFANYFGNRDGSQPESGKRKFGRGRRGTLSVAVLFPRVGRGAGMNLPKFHQLARE